jgi:integrase
VRLLEALVPTGRKNPLTLPIVQLALETGMRRSELLAMCWRDIDLIGQTVVLHTSKNGEGRMVPLSTKAVAVLKGSRTPPVVTDRSWSKVGLLRC